MIYLTVACFKGCTSLVCFGQDEERLFQLFSAKPKPKRQMAGPSTATSPKKRRHSSGGHRGGGDPNIPNKLGKLGVELQDFLKVHTRQGKVLSSGTLALYFRFAQRMLIKANNGHAPSYDDLPRLESAIRSVGNCIASRQ